MHMCMNHAICQQTSSSKAMVWLRLRGCIIITYDPCSLKKVTAVMTLIVLSCPWLQQVGCDLSIVYMTEKVGQWVVVADDKETVVPRVKFLVFFFFFFPCSLVTVFAAITWTHSPTQRSLVTTFAGIFRTLTVYRQVFYNFFIPLLVFWGHDLVVINSKTYL